LVNKPTIPTVPTSNTAFTNDAGYITSDDITGKTNQSDFTAHTANTTVHVTANEKSSWNAKSDFSGNYNDLSNKPTIPTVPTSNTAFTNDAGYITIDAISGKVDTSTYNTYTAATDTALANKQTTLTAGTGIDITDNVISATGGGGGKAIEAGRGISITTGETADTVSFNLPISAGTGTNSIKCGENTQANGTDSFAIGSNGVKANGLCSFAGGSYSEAKAVFSMAFGRYNTTNNYGEVAFGFFNKSNGSSSAAGNSSGNTLFSVGNGTNTTSNTRHNAFEIRQNGDIYLTLNGQDVKLQDQLGGSSITVDTALDSGSTNPVENRVIYSKFDEVEQVTAAELNNINDKINTISGNAVTSGWVESEIQTSLGNYVDYDSLDGSVGYLGYVKDNDVENAISGKVDTSTYNTYTAATDSRLSEDEEVTAAGLNALNDAFGGLKLMKISQTDYDNLQVKDQNTLYVVI
jgi:hypothetical protein